MARSPFRKWLFPGWNLGAAGEVFKPVMGFKGFVRLVF
jgi:hypothetical protein